MAAKTFTQLDSTVRVAESFAQMLKEARGLGRRLSDHYFALDFSDVIADPPPSYVQVDENGSLRGHSITPDDFVNLVNLAQQYEKFLTNSGPAAANYVPVIEVASNA